MARLRSNSIEDAPSASVAASPHWSVPAKKPPGFSPFVAFCFTVNYILGTGFLTIPWAFVQGGLVLSLLLLVLVCMFADMAKDYILETMARAEVMLDEQMRWLPSRPKGDPLLYSPVLPGGDSGNDELEAMPLATGNVDYNSMEMSQNNSPSQPGSNSMPGTPTSSRHGIAAPGVIRRELIGRQLVRKATPKYMVKHRKFEVNALCRVFLGRWGKDLYMLFLSLYIYCTLWAYTSVFASALARKFPIDFLWGESDSSSYTVYALAFGVIVVPMSCMELDEQIVVQVFLTGCRFLMVFLMVGTSAVCSEEQLNEMAQDGDVDATVGTVPMWRPSGLHKMLPIVVFATIYHHSIPGLVHPVADKKELSPVFISTNAFCCLAYCFIGIVLGSAFGNNIEQSANLNWHSFTGETDVLDADGNLIEAAWWAQAVSLYVMLFPALDVMSAFPLNAITLGNNMLSAFYGRRIHEVENNRCIRIQFRILAAIPPIILAIFVRELGTITGYAGTSGFILTFSFPALLYIKSRQQAAKRSFSEETYYTSYASSYPLAVVLLGFGVGMMAFCIVLQL